MGVRLDESIRSCDGWQIGDAASYQIILDTVIGNFPASCCSTIDISRRLHYCHLNVILHFMLDVNQSSWHIQLIISTDEACSTQTKPDM